MLTKPVMIADVKQKKVAAPRVFNKVLSVFDKFKEDNPSILNRCFMHDKIYWKLTKFIRDEVDVSDMPSI